MIVSGCPRALRSPRLSPRFSPSFSLSSRRSFPSSSAIYPPPPLSLNFNRTDFSFHPFFPSFCSNKGRTRDRERERESSTTTRTTTITTTISLQKTLKQRGHHQSLDHLPETKPSNFNQSRSRQEEGNVGCA